MTHMACKPPESKGMSKSELLLIARSWFEALKQLRSPVLISMTHVTTEGPIVSTITWDHVGF